MAGRDKDDDDFLPGSFRDWSEERSLEKLENITRSIASIYLERLPAVTGISEVENKTVLTDLLYQPAFKGNHDYIHHESPDRRGIEVALIYDRNYLTVLSQQRIPVVLASDEDFSTPEQYLKP